MNRPLAHPRTNYVVPVHEHRVVVAVVVAYIVLGLLLGQALRIPDMMGQLLYGRTYILYWALLVYSGLVAITWERWKLRDPSGRRLAGRAGWMLAWREMRNRLRNPAYGGAILLLAILVPTFMNAFGSWKSAIPHLRDFAWDRTFMEFDRTLHFGRHPWEWLHPLLGHPAVTAMWDYGYSLFIPIQITVVLWMTWSPDRALRRRFFAAYTLAWVLLGTGAATLLSSAGPCFYGALTGLPNPYQPLLNYLGTVDATYSLGALEAQAVLWANYTKQVAAPFAGISAMPSMHVAMPTIFVLLTWRGYRRLAWLMIAYLAFNILGAVHLAWHYAIDAYAAILGGALVWVLAGRLTRQAPNHGDSARPRPTPMEPAVPQPVASSGV